MMSKLKGMNKPKRPEVKNWSNFVSHMHCLYFSPPVKGGIRVKAKPKINQSLIFSFIVVQLGIAATMAPIILHLNLKIHVVALFGFPHKSIHGERVPKEIFKGKQVSQTAKAGKHGKARFRFKTMAGCQFSQPRMSEGSGRKAPANLAVVVKYAAAQHSKHML